MIGLSRTRDCGGRQRGRQASGSFERRLRKRVAGVGSSGPSKKSHSISLEWRNYSLEVPITSPARIIAGVPQGRCLQRRSADRWEKHIPRDRSLSLACTKITTASRNAQKNTRNPGKLSGWLGTCKKHSSRFFIEVASLSVVLQNLNASLLCLLQYLYPNPQP